MKRRQSAPSLPSLDLAIADAHQRAAISAAVELNWNTLSSALFGRVVKIGSLSVTGMKHRIVAGATAGLWRIGVTAAHEGEQPRTFIIKQLAPADGGSARWKTSKSQRDPFFWGREALVYADSFFEDPGHELRAARCYLIDDAGPGVWLYLEDVQGKHGADWSVVDYGIAAQKLGLFQSRISLKVDSRLAQPNAFFLTYLERRNHVMENACEIMRSSAPFLQGEGLDSYAELIERLWKKRERLLILAEETPLTRCHFDFWPSNLFLSCVDGNPQLVAIDLAFSGIGSMGHDAANLVADGVLDFFIDSDMAHETWKCVQTSYFKAIGAHIGEGDLDRIALAMEVTVALKYAWMIPATFLAARGEEMHDGLRQEHGDLDQFFRRRSSALRFIGEFIGRAAEFV